MLSTFMVFASMLAADPVRTTEPGAISDSRPVPKAAKSKRTFRPLRFLRRLGSAESEFALRLSSLGIQREGEAEPAEALPHPRPVTEASTARPQTPSGASE
jgi:hypothetical protein